MDSVEGQGSTFTLTLYHPIAEDTEMVHSPAVVAEELEDQPALQRGPEGLSGRVLLAEDGLDNQLLLSTILRRQGLEVELVGDGEAAVARAEEALEQSAPFDLILMDMQMPKLDGYGATARLRSRGYSGPIIALTAHAMSGERERCLTAGCDDYLSKPIDRPVLIAAVESCLHRVRGGEAGAAARQETEGSRRGPDSDSGLIYSSYADDPDMEELVADFVERLPFQIHDIRLAAGDGDREILRRLAHQLKGAAGGYGFMPVSRKAEELEAAVRDGAGADRVDQAVDALATVCDRVRSGTPGEADA